LRLQGTWTDGQTDGRMDGQTDGRTDGVIPIYPLTLFVGGMGMKTVDIKLIRLYTVKTVQTNILSISMHIYKCICICKN
jgi:hypothetical protein